VIYYVQDFGGKIMDKFEYKTLLVSLFNEKTSEGLNELGSEGWELISAATVSGAGIGYYLFFKRKI